MTGLARSLVPLLLAAACSSTPPPEPNATPTAGAPAGAMPAVSASDVETLDGVVHEVQSAGHYTYVRVGPEGAEGSWAVVLGRLDATPGSAMTLRVHGHKADFHSRRLDRDFDDLYFARVIDRA